MSSGGVVAGALRVNIRANWSIHEQVSAILAFINVLIFFKRKHFFFFSEYIQYSDNIIYEKKKKKKKKKKVVNFQLQNRFLVKFVHYPGWFCSNSWNCFYCDFLSLPGLWHWSRSGWGPMGTWELGCHSLSCLWLEGHLWFLFSDQFLRWLIRSCFKLLPWKW